MLHATFIILGRTAVGDSGCLSGQPSSPADGYKTRRLLDSGWLPKPECVYASSLHAVIVGTLLPTGDIIVMWSSFGPSGAAKEYFS